MGRACGSLGRNCRRGRGGIQRHLAGQVLPRLGYHLRGTGRARRVHIDFVRAGSACRVAMGVAVAGLVLITLVVTSALHQDRYFLSVAFGLLFVALSDPGGKYLPRLSRMAVVGLIGALLTAAGYALGGDAWGFVVLAVFVVTVVSGLADNNDVHALVAGVLLNVWFVITLSAAAGQPARGTTHPWNQALAWLIGAGIAIALTTALWLLRDESRRRSWLPEIPDDLPP